MYGYSFLSMQVNTLGQIQLNLRRLILYEICMVGKGGERHLLTVQYLCLYIVLNEILLMKISLVDIEYSSCSMFTSFGLTSIKK